MFVSAGASSSWKYKHNAIEIYNCGFTLSPMRVKYSRSNHLHESAVSSTHDGKLRVFRLISRVERIACEPAARELVEVVARVGCCVHLRQHGRTHFDARRTETCVLRVLKIRHNSKFYYTKDSRGPNFYDYICTVQPGNRTCRMAVICQCRAIRGN